MSLSGSKKGTLAKKDPNVMAHNYHKHKNTSSRNPKRKKNRNYSRDLWNKFATRIKIENERNLMTEIAYLRKTYLKMCKLKMHKHLILWKRKFIKVYNEGRKVPQKTKKTKDNKIALNKWRKLLINVILEQRTMYIIDAIHEHLENIKLGFNLFRWKTLSQARIAVRKLAPIKQYRRGDINSEEIDIPKVNIRNAQANNNLSKISPQISNKNFSDFTYYSDVSPSRIPKARINKREETNVNLSTYYSEENSTFFQGQKRNISYTTIDEAYNTKETFTEQQYDITRDNIETYFSEDKTLDNTVNTKFSKTTPKEINESEICYSYEYSTLENNRKANKNHQYSNVKDSVKSYVTSSSEHTRIHSNTNSCASHPEETSTYDNDQQLKQEIQFKSKESYLEYSEEPKSLEYNSNITRGRKRSQLKYANERQYSEGSYSVDRIQSTKNKNPSIEISDSSVEYCNNNQIGKSASNKSSKFVYSDELEYIRSVEKDQLEIEFSTSESYYTERNSPRKTAKRKTKSSVKTSSDSSVKQNKLVETSHETDKLPNESLILTSVRESGRKNKISFVETPRKGKKHSRINNSSNSVEVLNRWELIIKKSFKEVKTNKLISAVSLLLDERRLSKFYSSWVKCFIYRRTKSSILMKWKQLYILAHEDIVSANFGDAAREFLTIFLLRRVISSWRENTHVINGNKTNNSIINWSRLIIAVLKEVHIERKVRAIALHLEVLRIYNIFVIWRAHSQRQIKLRRKKLMQERPKRVLKKWKIMLSALLTEMKNDYYASAISQYLLDMRLKYYFSFWLDIYEQHNEQREYEQSIAAIWYRLSMKMLKSFYRGQAFTILYEVNLVSRYFHNWYENARREISLRIGEEIIKERKVLRVLNNWAFLAMSVIKESNMVQAVSLKLSYIKRNKYFYEWTRMIPDKNLKDRWHILTLKKLRFHRINQVFSSYQRYNTLLQMRNLIYRLLHKRRVDNIKSEKFHCYVRGRWLHLSNMLLCVYSIQNCISHHNKILLRRMWMTLAKKITKYYVLNITYMLKVIKPFFFYWKQSTILKMATNRLLRSIFQNNINLICDSKQVKSAIVIQRWWRLKLFIKRNNKKILNFAFMAWIRYISDRPSESDKEHNKGAKKILTDAITRVNSKQTAYSQIETTEGQIRYINELINDTNVNASTKEEQNSMSERLVYDNPNTDANVKETFQTSLNNEHEYEYEYYYDDEEINTERISLDKFKKSSLELMESSVQNKENDEELGVRRGRIMYSDYPNLTPQAFNFIYNSIPFLMNNLVIDIIDTIDIPIVISCRRFKKRMKGSLSNGVSSTESLTYETATYNSSWFDTSKQSDSSPLHMTFTQDLYKIALAFTNVSCRESIKVAVHFAIAVSIPDIILSELESLMHFNSLLTNGKVAQSIENDTNAENVSSSRDLNTEQISFENVTADICDNPQIKEGNEFHSHRNDMISNTSLSDGNSESKVVYYDRMEDVITELPVPEISENYHCNSHNNPLGENALNENTNDYILSLNITNKSRTSKSDSLDYIYNNNLDKDLCECNYVYKEKQLNKQSEEYDGTEYIDLKTSHMVHKMLVNDKSTKMELNKSTSPSSVFGISELNSVEGYLQSLQNSEKAITMSDLAAPNVSNPNEKFIFKLNEINTTLPSMDNSTRIFERRIDTIEGDHNEISLHDPSSEFERNVEKIRMNQSSSRESASQISTKFAYLNETKDSFERNLCRNNVDIETENIQCNVSIGNEKLSEHTINTDSYNIYTNASIDSDSSTNRTGLVNKELEHMNSKKVETLDSIEEIQASFNENEYTQEEIRMSNSYANYETTPICLKDPKHALLKKRKRFANARGSQNSSQILPTGSFVIESEYDALTAHNTKSNFVSDLSEPNDYIFDNFCETASKANLDNSNHDSLNKFEEHGIFDPKDTNCVVKDIEKSFDYVIRISVIRIFRGISLFDFRYALYERDLPEGCPIYGINGITDFMFTKVYEVIQDTLDSILGITEKVNYTKPRTSIYDSFFDRSEVTSLINVKESKFKKNSSINCSNITIDLDDEINLSCNNPSIIESNNEKHVSLLDHSDCYSSEDRNIKEASSSKCHSVLHNISGTQSSAFHVDERSDTNLLSMKSDPRSKFGINNALDNQDIVNTTSTITRSRNIIPESDSIIPNTSSHKKDCIDKDSYKEEESRNKDHFSINRYDSRRDMNNPRHTESLHPSIELISPLQLKDGNDSKFLTKNTCISHYPHETEKSLEVRVNIINTANENQNISKRSEKASSSVLRGDTCSRINQGTILDPYETDFENLSNNSLSNDDLLKLRGELDMSFFTEGDISMNNSILLDFGKNDVCVSNHFLNSNITDIDEKHDLFPIIYFHGENQIDEDICKIRYDCLKWYQVLARDVINEIVKETLINIQETEHLNIPIQNDSTQLNNGNQLQSCLYNPSYVEAPVQFSNMEQKRGIFNNMMLDIASSHGSEYIQQYNFSHLKKSNHDNLLDSLVSKSVNHTDMSKLITGDHLHDAQSNRDNVSIQCSLSDRYSSRTQIMFDETQSMITSNYNGKLSGECTDKRVEGDLNSSNNNNSIVHKEKSNDGTDIKLNSDVGHNSRCKSSRVSGYDSDVSHKSNISSHEKTDSLEMSDNNNTVQNYVDHVDLLNDINQIYAPSDETSPNKNRLYDPQADMQLALSANEISAVNSSNTIPNISSSVNNVNTTLDIMKEASEDVSPKQSEKYFPMKKGIKKVSPRKRELSSKKSKSMDNEFSYSTQKECLTVSDSAKKSKKLHENKMQDIDHTTVTHSEDETASNIRNNKLPEKLLYSCSEPSSNSQANVIIYGKSPEYNKNSEHKSSNILITPRTNVISRDNFNSTSILDEISEIMCEPDDSPKYFGHQKGKKGILDEVIVSSPQRFSELSNSRRSVPINQDESYLPKVKEKSFDSKVSDMLDLVDSPSDDIEYSHNIIAREILNDIVDDVVEFVTGRNMRLDPNEQSLDDESTEAVKKLSEEDNDTNTISPTKSRMDIGTKSSHEYSLNVSDHMKMRDDDKSELVDSFNDHEQRSSMPSELRTFHQDVMNSVNSTTPSIISDLYRNFFNNNDFNGMLGLDLIISKEMKDIHSFISKFVTRTVISGFFELVGEVEQMHSYFFIDFTNVIDHSQQVIQGYTTNIIRSIYENLNTYDLLSKSDFTDKSHNTSLTSPSKHKDNEITIIQGATFSTENIDTIKTMDDFQKIMNHEYKVIGERNEFDVNNTHMNDETDNILTKEEIQEIDSFSINLTYAMIEFAILSIFDPVDDEFGPKGLSKFDNDFDEACTNHDGDASLVLPTNSNKSKEESQIHLELDVLHLNFDDIIKIIENEVFHFLISLTNNTIQTIFDSSDSTKSLSVLELSDTSDTNINQPDQNYANLQFNQLDLGQKITIKPSPPQGDIAKIYSSGVSGVVGIVEAVEESADPRLFEFPKNFADRYSVTYQFVITLIVTKTLNDIRVDYPLLVDNHVEGVEAVNLDFYRLLFDTFDDSINNVVHGIFSYFITKSYLNYIDTTAYELELGTEHVLDDLVTSNNLNTSNVKKSENNKEIGICPASKVSFEVLMDTNVSSFNEIIDSGHHIITLDESILGTTEDKSAKEQSIYIPLGDYVDVLYDSISDISIHPTIDEPKPVVLYDLDCLDLSLLSTILSHVCLAIDKHITNFNLRQVNVKSYLENIFDPAFKECDAANINHQEETHTMPDLVIPYQDSITPDNNTYLEGDSLHISIPHLDKILGKEYDIHPDIQEALDEKLTLEERSKQPLGVPLVFQNFHHHGDEHKGKFNNDEEFESTKVSNADHKSSAYATSKQEKDRWNGSIRKRKEFSSSPKITIEETIEKTYYESQPSVSTTKQSSNEDPKKKSNTLKPDQIVIDEMKTLNDLHEHVFNNSPISFSPKLASAIRTSSSEKIGLIIDKNESISVTNAPVLPSPKSITSSSDEEEVNQGKKKLKKRTKSKKRKIKVTIKADKLNNKLEPTLNNCLHFAINDVICRAVLDIFPGFVPHEQNIIQDSTSSVRNASFPMLDSPSFSTHSHTTSNANELPPPFVPVADKSAFGTPNESNSCSDYSKVESDSRKDEKSTSPKVVLLSSSSQTRQDPSEDSGLRSHQRVEGRIKPTLVKLETDMFKCLVGTLTTVVKANLPSEIIVSQLDVGNLNSTEEDPSTIGTNVSEIRHTLTQRQPKENVSVIDIHKYGSKKSWLRDAIFRPMKTSLNGATQRLVTRLFEDIENGIGYVDTNFLKKKKTDLNRGLYDESYVFDDGNFNHIIELTEQSLKFALKTSISDIVCNLINI